MKKIMSERNKRIKLKKIKVFCARVYIPKFLIGF